MARERIPIRHYPHRDPQQMQRRFRLRAAIMRMGGATGNHWRLEDWRQEIVDNTGMSTALRRNTEGLAGEGGIDIGPLHYWTRGEPLSHVRLYNHIATIPTRTLQRIIHPIMLPILDRFRPKFNPRFQPVSIPPDVNVNLGTLADDSIVRGINES